jgi:four helix bundle protein
MDFFCVEDLQVYQKLCQLHLDVCEATRSWPQHERFELGAQVRRASNSAPANLAEKHNDRHPRNKIEGINRARGEALETVHHLFIARLKNYVSPEQYAMMKQRYQECVRMLNGLERTHERQLPRDQRLWPDAAAPTDPSHPNL